MKCKKQIYFRYLANRTGPEAAPGQRHASGDAGAAELGPCERIADPAVFAHLSGIHAGIVYHRALIFSIAGQEFQACPIGCR